MNTNFDFNVSYHYWIINLGATSHICCSKEQFNSFKCLHDSHILLPNSTKVKVEGIGSIKLNDDIFLHNVLFIPTFRFNLLSLLSLINDNSFQFTMQPNSFVLQDLKTLKRIGTARQHQGLLLFDFPKSSFHNTSIQSCNVVKYETWHHRLGHIPIPVYKLICNNVSLSSIDSKFHCEVYPIAKQNRLAFINQNNCSVELFDLIHADIWGPFREVTFDGFKYFLTLVDDKSRFTWIYLLKNKFDCLFIIPQFSHMWKTNLKPLSKGSDLTMQKSLPFQISFQRKVSYTNFPV